jgi:1-acyl-sn-glycerol-3-phosphate acyltransferase
MGKKKKDEESKKEKKARKKKEKARAKEEKRLRAAEKAAARAAKEEAALEKRERALLRRVPRPAKRRAKVVAEAPAEAATAEVTPGKPARRRRSPAAKPGKGRARPAPTRRARATAPAPSRGGVPEALLEPEAVPARTDAGPDPATHRGPRGGEPVDASESFDSMDSPEEVEARLDRFLRRAMGPQAAGRAREVLVEGTERLAERLGQDGAEPRPGSVLGSARDLLSSDAVLRAWGQLGMRGRSIDVDEYGLDPKVAARWQPFFDFLYGTYWRVQTRGVHHVPDAGRCLIVANHSGTIPYDGAMIKTAVAREHSARRPVRWLAEDFVFHFPFVGAFMNRIGAVRACQENAERMLRQERLVAVFPEGIKGIGKLYQDRYKLQRFGRGGYIKLVLRTGAPIVPVAVVGAEEIHPLLLRGRTLANMIGMPYIPITPTFPWLGPLGLVPLPSQWLIEFGEPITFEDLSPEAAEDPILVNRLNDQVRARIQEMVDRLLAERASRPRD